MSSFQITPQIARRYNRFNQARREKGIPLIGDPMSVVGFRYDDLPTERKGTSAYAVPYKRKAQPPPPMRRNPEPVKQTEKIASPSGFAKGGLVKKSGMAMVHEGEFVLTKEQYKTLKSLIS